MLRISFTTPDAINLENNFDERSKHYSNQNEHNLETKFFNFLINKKDFFFHKLVSKKNLLRFYRLLHYKLN